MRNLTLFLLLIFLISTIARASDFSYMPSQSEPQKELKAALEHGDYRQALKTWGPATQRTIFADSENGRAVYGLLLAQNGLPVSAMKMVLRDTSANHLNSGIVELWKPILNSYVSEISPGWNINASWKRLFSSADRTQQLWRTVTSAPQKGNVKAALAALSELRKTPQSLIGNDQLELATARVLYQKGDVDQAIQHYSAVPKSSDFWNEAIEERAWAYLRKNDHDRALSDLTTVLSPAFAKTTGPEPYFLLELESLKVCDYPKILKTSKLFKERHKERLSELEKLAKTGVNKGINSVFSGFDESGYTSVAAGSAAQWMPRNFMRDREFAKNMKLRTDLMTENRRAQSKLKDLASSDPKFAAVLAENQQQADLARAAAALRLKQLAEIEIVEYRHILNKLHIVEGEVVERLHVDESLKGKRRDVAPIADAHNTISFPYSDKEVWLDELDHYQSSVKNCPSLTSTKGASL